MSAELIEKQPQNPVKSPKASIFICKQCKQSEIKVERKPKSEDSAEQPKIAKLEPAKSSN